MKNIQQKIILFMQLHLWGENNMPKCSYCSQDFEFPIGVMVVDSTTGNIKFFCSKKCRKNSEMFRRKKKWAIKLESSVEEKK